MKCLRLLSILNGLFLSSNVAATLVTPMPSAYADFTLNAPWVAEIQDMESTDMTTTEQSQGYSSDNEGDTTQDTTDIQQFLQEIYSEKIPSVLWQFIEMPSMIGVNNASREQFTLNDVNQLKQVTPENQLDVFSM